jgi:hypothetical protein
MMERKKSGAMLPLIVIGAALFGAGIYQNSRPKVPEVNTGFIAPPPPENPRTMQAPDAPPMEKDAAQRAAEADQTTTPPPKSDDKSSVRISLSDVPWIQGLITSKIGNFREGALKSLKTEQDTGGINCSPVLTDAVSTIEQVSCTAKDGAQIKGEFDEVGDGELRIEATDGATVSILKNETDFRVEVENRE